MLAFIFFLNINAWLYHLLPYNVKMENYELLVDTGKLWILWLTIKC